VNFLSDPIPWDAPSRFGVAGRVARAALRRVTRPLEIRQRAREEQLVAALRAIEAQVAELESRWCMALIADGHQIGWAVGALGRRMDELERRVGHATTLAGPGAEELELVRSVRCRDQLPELLNALGLTRHAAEIGVYKGEFSELLLSRWQGSKLLSIDPWQPDENVSADRYERFFGEAQGRLSTFGCRSQIWRLSSEDAAHQVDVESLDFAYLDARHDEESVTRDLELWWPRIRIGGVLAGHDYLDGELAVGGFGVKSAVDRFFCVVGQPVHVTVDDQPWPSWIVLRAP
jgi:hypothetical protein